MLNVSKTYFRVLAIAGSDSSGGAGVQADLKTLGALGCYGMTAITCITVQNTCGVQSVYSLDASLVAQQINAVIEDMGADAIKIGALATQDIAEAVMQVVHCYPEIPVVLDPVLQATSGFSLFEISGLPALRHLLRRALIVTPNLPEASLLVGRSLSHRSDVEKAAQELLDMGASSVLIKGGHLQGSVGSDYFLQKNGYSMWLEGSYVETLNTHGTGCTYSAAIAGFTAHGKELYQAVSKAKNYLQNALEAGAAYTIGKGHGSPYHFWGR